jgi:BirA family transcriptional regulator, biotin operon repressor / biotin---[acetyl-CoA-carboxylase] ligase
MIGTPRVHHRLTDSTNERAKALAAAGAPHGTLVTADEQTAGRGRQGRLWTAPARSSLLMSLVLRNLDERDALLPLAAAVAVCEAVPAQAAIKWPNDIWIDRRKLAGILIEGRPREGWEVLAAWRARDALKGERVRWSGGEGTADGIDDSGALLVQTRNGPVTLDAGEVHLER